jgi:hypothetical protein
VGIEVSESGRQETVVVEGGKVRGAVEGRVNGMEGDARDLITRIQYINATVGFYLVKNFALPNLVDFC